MIERCCGSCDWLRERWIGKSGAILNGRCHVPVPYWVDKRHPMRVPTNGQLCAVWQAEPGTEFNRGAEGV